MLFVVYILLWYNPKMGLCILGSSLNFSASGGRGKEKNLKPAEKIAAGSEGEAEATLSDWTISSFSLAG